MPDRWPHLARRRDAGILGDLVFATKPQLAMDQLERLPAAGLPARWAAFDEVYGRSEKLRKQAAQGRPVAAGDHPVRLPATCSSAMVIRADEAVKDAAFERRSCGNGSGDLGYKDSAMTATSIEGQSSAPIRRADPPPGPVHLLPVSSGRPRPDLFHHHRRRRWPVEKTFKTGKDGTAGDQSQARLRGHLPAHRTGRLACSAPPPSAAR